MTLWQLSRSIDHTLVERQILKLKKFAARGNPDIRRFGQRQLARPVFQNNFQNAGLAESAHGARIIQNFPRDSRYPFRFKRQPQKRAGIQQCMHHSPQSLISSRVSGRKASSGTENGASITSPTLGRATGSSYGISFAKRFLPREITMVSPWLTSCSKADKWVFASWVATNFMEANYPQG